MKTIKFSEQELGFIRQQYQVELEEAEEYVENLKNILKKIGVPDAFTVAEQVVKEPARRGRKPKVRKELPAPEAEPVEKKRKPRSDKGKKRAKRNQPVIQEKSINETTPSKDSRKPDSKTVVPKKKVKRRPRRRGVYLTSLRKPL
jgi:hypothetical protein